MDEASYRFESDAEIEARLREFFAPLHGSLHSVEGVRAILNMRKPKKSTFPKTRREVTSTREDIIAVRILEEILAQKVADRRKVNGESRRVDTHD